MAWTTPRTWVFSEIVTDSEMNTHIRDNLNELWKGIATGDMEYYASSTGKSRLAIGGEGRILGSWGGVPRWERARGAYMAGGVLTVVHHNAITAISPFLTSIYHDGGFAVDENTRITIPAQCSGVNLWLLFAQGYWDTNNTGNRQLGIRLSGSSTYLFNTVPALQGSQTWQQYLGLRTLSPGDYIELVTLQTSGGDLNFRNGELGMILLR